LSSAKFAFVRKYLIGFVLFVGLFLVGNKYGFEYVASLKLTAIAM